MHLGRPQLGPLSLYYAIVITFFATLPDLTLGAPAADQVCSSATLGRIVYVADSATVGRLWACRSTGASTPPSWSVLEPITPAPTGATGARGAAGAAGADGAAGPIGPAGAQGPAGANGADGAQGPQGAQGAQGPQGTAGTNGASVYHKRYSQGRLSLDTSTAITTSDQTAKTTVYFVPYLGGQISLYNGSSWIVRTLGSSISVGVPATTSTNFDIFAYDNSGTVTLETVDWSSNTARATDLTDQDGILVKSGAPTRRYLGTGRTTTSSGQIEDSVTKRFLWNYYHRQPRTLRASHTSNHTYNSNTTRSCANATNTRVEVVVGYANTALDLNIHTIASGTYGDKLSIGIGMDRTNGADSDINALIREIWNKFSGALIQSPALGYHYYQCVESNWSTGATGVYNTTLTGVIEG